jgi:NitT/TauT family transport system substrate-binding protein
MKSRIIRLLSLCWLSILLVTACNGTTSVTSKPEHPPLQIAASVWAGYFPMAIAQEKGFFAANGVTVKPLYSKNFLAHQSKFLAGEYDGLAIALGSIMSIIDKNPNLQVVMVADYSNGADVVVANSDIKSVPELKGKRLGLKLGNFGELFVVKMLETNGLTTDDVMLVNVDPEQIPARLRSGEIQAGQTWDPYKTQAVKAGAKVLFSSEQTPSLIPDVLMFRSDTIRDRPNEVKAFIKSWFQAQEYWKANPEESKALIAKTLDIKPTEVSTDGIQLSGLQENLKAFTPGTTEQSLYHTAKLYADFYIRRGGLSAAPDIRKLINPSFVQQLQKVN